MWTIYNSPDDYPGRVVLRKFRTAAGVPVPAGEPHVCASVAEARQRVPAGLVRFPRDVSDPPSVVETWL